MNLFEFLPYAIALGIAASIPGPGIAASVGKALGSGLKPAFYFLNGLVLGDITYLTFAILGLAAIASVFSGFFIVIKFLGAAYLLWLAWNFWNAGIDPAKMSSAKGKSFWPSFISGYVVTISNPKVIIFYIALLPSVIDLNNINLNDYLVLIVLTIAVLYLVVLPYILLATSAKEFLRSPKALKYLNRGAASAMVGAAAFIVFKK
ncbi:MAG: LysE family translocator [Devosiaceae bacterium]|nr:LysE family translocator [Devosiaceae bacterium]